MPAAFLSSLAPRHLWPLLVLALMATVPTPASAQRLQHTFLHGAHSKFNTGESRVSASGILGSGDNDYRYEGLFVGLGAGAAFSIVSAVQCSGRHDCISPYVLGPIISALAGVTGALVGSMFPK
jgi:hypothetical protein